MRAFLQPIRNIKDGCKLMSNIENQKPVFVTLDESAKRLGVLRGTLHKHIKLGKIRSILRFGRRLIPESELDRLWREGTGE